MLVLLPTAIDVAVTPLPENVIDGLPPANGTEKPVPVNVAAIVFVVVSTLPVFGVRLEMVGAAGARTVKIVVAVPPSVVRVKIRAPVAVAGEIAIVNWMVVSLTTEIPDATTPLPEKLIVGLPPARPVENPVPVKVALTITKVLPETVPLDGLRLEIVGAGTTGGTTGVVLPTVQNAVLD